MTNKTHFSPASEKGHFDGLVDEGKYLRQSSLYKQILPRTPSRPKTSVNPVILSNFSSCSSCLRGEKISVISVKPRLIKDLRSTKVYVRKNNLFMQNKANFQKSQMNLSKVLVVDYDKMDTWSSGKNKPNSKPIQTQFKANTNPKQTQYKANQTQPVVSLSNLFRGENMLLSLTINPRRVSFGYYADKVEVPNAYDWLAKSNNRTVVIKNTQGISFTRRQQLKKIQDGSQTPLATIFINRYYIDYLSAI
jgi:hypothetical protein